MLNINFISIWEIVISIIQMEECGSIQSKLFEFYIFPVLLVFWSVDFFNIPVPSSLSIYVKNLQQALDIRGKN